MPDQTSHSPHRPSKLAAVAPDEQLRILAQGACAWNTWREAHELFVPDLICTDLQGADLAGIDFTRAEIPRAKLNRATLIGANFSGAAAIGAEFRNADLGGGKLAGTTLSEADLSGANLSLANLSGANLMRANLAGANLLHANLMGANLAYASLTGANLSGADLSGANLLHADLMEASLNLAIFCQTILAAVDLSHVLGLESCRHLGPSILDHQTLARSGPLPLTFLRGCGLPDELIRYWLERATPHPNGRPCFLLYAPEDQVLAERLYTSLQSQGLRCWLALPGKGRVNIFWSALDRAVTTDQKWVLLLSEHAIRSGQFARQVKAALTKEQSSGHRSLFPLALDAAALQSAEPWLQQLRVAREVLDFRPIADAGGSWVSVGRLLAEIKAVASSD